MKNVKKYLTLKKRIEQVIGCENKFATAIGLTSDELHLKLSNESEWTFEEIDACVSVLNLDPHFLAQYFWN